MKWLAIVLVLGAAGCAKHSHQQNAQTAPATSVPPPNTRAMQSSMPVKAGAEMQLIPIPKDKTQLARLVSMGYTIHENHMHPPGVKSCPFDKKGGSVIE